MADLDTLIRLARHSGRLMAQDNVTGARVLIKRGPLGMRVECYINDERTVRKYLNEVVRNEHE